MTSSERFNELLLDLCWSLWTELGVRGTARTHSDWSIDPEALILLTARLGERDPRLRDESLDWCIKSQRHLSMSRLRTLTARIYPSFPESYGKYAATVSQFGPQRWPGATKPLRYNPTGKSAPPDLSRAALIRLRLRSIFGVSARAEIIHALLGKPQEWTSAADLAQLTAYGKRNILEELDGLEQAGVAQAKTHLNRRIYRLHDPKTILKLTGPSPRQFPNWGAIATAATTLSIFLPATESADKVLRDVAANNTLDELAPHIDPAGLPPLPPGGPDAAQRLQAWALDSFDGLAAGRE